jgi:hypothetical protein
MIENFLESDWVSDIGIYPKGATTFWAKCDIEPSAARSNTILTARPSLPKFGRMIFCFHSQNFDPESIQVRPHPHDAAVPRNKGAASQ